MSLTASPVMTRSATKRTDIKAGPTKRRWAELHEEVKNRPVNVIFTLEIELQLVQQVFKVTKVEEQATAYYFFVLVDGIEVPGYMNGGRGTLYL